MEQTSEHYNFYRILRVQPEAGDAEMQRAHAELTAAMVVEDAPAEKMKEAALELVAVEAARHALTSPAKRESFDAKLAEAQQAESEKEKIETKRAGKLQEQQSIEDDEKLKQVSLRLEAATEALADFYFEQLFAVAREGNIQSIPLDKLLEWLSSERMELLRKAEQKGRKVAFRIDWHGLGNVQEERKRRGEEIEAIVERLATQLREEEP
jgi:aldehyde:ferredoxin oxidoreductase